MSGGHAEQPPPAAPTGRHIATQLKWLAAGEAIGQAAWYAMILVLAAILEPRAFGTVAVGMAIVRVARMITTAGTGGALIAADRITPADVRAALRRTLVGAFVFTVVILVSGGLLAKVFAGGSDPDVLRVLGLSVTLAALAIVPQALLKKALDFRRVSTVGAVAAVVTSVVAIVAALLGAGVWALVLRQLLFEALMAVLLWQAARRVLPDLLGRPAEGERGTSPAGRRAFLVISASSMVAMTLDNMIVGAVLDVRELGYYALAFSIAFAPLTQLSWRLGTLLFPAAAATKDLATVGRRTVTIVRVSALVLLPIVPAAAVLAPVVVPAVLGEKWGPMVRPLQILLVVGVAHAITNVIGESLSGTGNVGRRAWWDAAWAGLTLVAVAVLAHVWGISGAAAGHLVGFLPLAIGYGLIGIRLIGSGPRQLWAALRAIVLAVSLQTGVSLSLVHALGGPSDPGAALVAAIAGLLVAATILRAAPSRPLAEVTDTIRLLRGRRSPALAGA